jgi:hypothetical protein
LLQSAEPSIRLRVVTDLPTKDQAGVELARIGSFITGTTLEVRWIREIVPLTDRRAGWVLKPLHDR